MTTIKCPSYLDDEAKKEWKRILKILKLENRDFTEKDIKALECYCTSYSDVRKFTKLLEDTGYLIYSPNGYPQQHPYCQLKKNAEQEMRNWMKELGLTTASRARMSKNQIESDKDNKTQEEQEMEEVMS